MCIKMRVEGSSLEPMTPGSTLRVDDTSHVDLICPTIRDVWSGKDIKAKKERKETWAAHVDPNSPLLI